MVAPVEPGKSVYELEDGSYTEWYVVENVWTEESVEAVLESEDERMRVDALELEREIFSDRDGWRASEPRNTSPDLERKSGPTSPTELKFERVQGRGSRTEVNAFLEGESGLVYHELGGVSSWKAAFVGRYEGEIVSAIVIHAYHPSQNGTDAVITRVANDELAPANTSSWIIARARNWAERAGYERVVSYAGVGGNGGTCYRAAGFDLEGEPERVEGKSWTANDGEEWVKQKYVYELEPSKFAELSEADATAAVATSRAASA